MDAYFVTVSDTTMATYQTRKLIQKASLLSKYKGSLVGGVVGDCLGAYFEMSFDVQVEAVTTFFEKLKKHAASQSKPTKSSPRKEKLGHHEFTDDTAMARSVAKSLIEHKELNVNDMAQRFVAEYHKEPGRGYGGNVVTVFKKLREEDCSDPHKPASEQFDGQGSYGNGAAMRIAPAALYGYHLPNTKLNELVEDISKITHTHRDAVIGAQLLCIAVKAALHQQASLDRDKFIEHLHTHADQLESASMSTASSCDSSPEAKRRSKRSSEECEKPYCLKLEKIKEFLHEKMGKQSTIEEVLGNDISALGSVPAAIFSFLHCNLPIPDFKTENAFERTILYAISLGGDTDTIATMAGAIAGAYYGIESIPKHWQDRCEGVYDALTMAEQLHQMVESNKQGFTDSTIKDKK